DRGDRQGRTPRGRLCQAPRRIRGYVNNMERIVLAYSGGLATSAAIPWLKEHFHAEIVAVTMDLGQERELEAVRDRALAVGALRAHVLDVRELFVHDYVLTALEADALVDDRPPMTPPPPPPPIAP